MKEKSSRMGFVNTVDRKQVHPVFKMFYLKEREI